MPRHLRWLLLGFGALTAGIAAQGYWRASQTALSYADAPNLPDLDGNVHSLNEWRGRLLVVNFWASWCEPCREEIPTLTRLQEQWTSAGGQISVLGIALDELDAVRDFLSATPINYPVRIGGRAAEAWSSSLGNRYAVLPFTVVLDGRGLPLKTWTGPFSTRELEESLMSAKSAAN